MRLSDTAVVRLFCQYTVASILISIAAWCAVGLGFVSVGAIETSTVDWFLAAQVYGCGATAVILLWKDSRFSFIALFVYLATQCAALVKAVVFDQLYFLPAAGSQGTVPAVLISLSFLSYLIVSSAASRRVFPRYG